MKRRCKNVIVCDADGDYTFGDLGGAIRKCRGDIGGGDYLGYGRLKPGTAAVGNAANAKESGTRQSFSKTHWAIGKIDYSLVEPKAGLSNNFRVKTRRSDCSAHT